MTKRNRWNISDQDWTFLTCFIISSVLVIFMAIIVAFRWGSDNRPHVHFSPQLFRNLSFKFRNRGFRRLKKFIGTESNPCEDFYSYVCGKWRRQHFPHANNTVRSVFKEVQHSIHLTLSRKLETVSKKEPQAFRRLKTFFRSCVKDISSKEGTTGDTKAFLKLMNFPWPDIKVTSNKEDLILNTMKISFLTKAAVLFKPDVTYSSFDFGILHLKIPLHPYAYLNSYQKENYSDFVSDLAKFLNSNLSQCNELGIRIHDTDKKLLSLDRGFVERKTMTFEELETVTNISKYKWTDALNGITLYAPSAKETARFSIEDTVLIENPVYLKNIFLFYLYALDVQQVYEYVTFRLLYSIMETSSALHSIKERYFGKVLRRTFKYNVINSVTDNCLYLLSKYMKYPLSAFAVAVLTSRQEVRDVSRIFRRIKNVYLEGIHTTKWMDETTTSRAVSRLQNLHFMPPPWLLASNTTFLNQLDENYTTINYASFLQLSSNLYSQYVIGKILSTKRKITRKTLYPIDLPWEALDLNAAIFYETDLVAISASFLRPPFYYINASRALNYGAIGSVIGSLIAKSLESMDSLYTGNSDEAKDWWTKESKIMYNVHLQCYASQAGFSTTFTSNPQQKRIIEELALEDIGLKTSYRAFEKETESINEKLPMAHINFTMDQVFFINYCYMLCATDELRKDHFTSKDKCNIHVSNVAEFGKAFNCKPKSRMYRTNRCSLWD